AAKKPREWAHCTSPANANAATPANNRNSCYGGRRSSCRSRINHEGHEGARRIGIEVSSCPFVHFVVKWFEAGIEQGIGILHRQLFEVIMPYIGIDFGTSNSVVANFQYGQAEVIPNHEGQKWTPSIVTMRRDGTLGFGQEAKENFDEQRSIRSIKRILGTP